MPALIAPSRRHAGAGASEAVAHEQRRALMPLVAGVDPHRAPKKRKPRQEISACLKWLCFFFNFIVFLVGVTLLALGLYLCVKDPRAIAEWADVVLNPAVLLSVIGSGVCIVSIIGALGALRDNITLLKTFALCVFACYILMVGLTFLLFILFYSDTTEGLSAHSILVYSIKKYHTNRNLADFVDYVQEQLECCGASSVSAGYRDWSSSPQFNCSAQNPYPERCGVPFSCCRRSVISEAAGSSNPLLPAMRSLECWQNALNKRPQDLEVDIHTRGCLQPLRVLFESHAVHIGAFVALIIIPVCLSVCLSNILAKQIDHQKFLLEREARRNERRRKRERQHRYRESYSGSTEQQLESGQLERKKPPEDIPPPLPSQPPPAEPPRHHRRPRRAASSSPNRKPSLTKVAESGSVGVKPLAAHHKDRRRRSLATSNEGRTKQWVLQQSDFVQHTPVA